MNKPIRTLSIFCLLLFLALMANVTWLQYGEAKSLDDHPGNARVIQAAFGRQRGAILVGKTTIARSVPSKDVYKFQRVYPKGPEYAPLTGYFSYYSQTAIEQSENEILSGDDSRLFVNNLANLVTNTEPKGGNVELTVDPKVQDAAWNGLRRLGKNVQGAAVAIQPSTGRILAMVSTPSFNPNKLADHDLKAVDKAYNRYNAAASQPLLNRTLQQTLPPGSTFKLVTASALFQDLHMTPNTLVDGNSSLKIPGTTHILHNENDESCGAAKVSMTVALENSCNVAFASAALKLTDQQLRSMAEAYGFGQRYLTGLAPQAPSVFPSGTLGGPLRALSAIGQYDVAETPLQMAMVASAIANHGREMKPYVVDRVTSPSLDVLSQTSPQQLSTPISSKTADEITQMMEAVVAHGTGVAAQIPGIQVAGKTGTAQSTASRPPYAWFTSFAPANNPQIAVAVLVQSSNTARTEIAGGALCAPIAKAMMEAVINP